MPINRVLRQQLVELRWLAEWGQVLLSAADFCCQLNVVNPNTSLQHGDGDTWMEEEEERAKVGAALACMERVPICRARRVISTAEPGRVSLRVCNCVLWRHLWLCVGVQHARMRHRGDLTPIGSLLLRFCANLVSCH